eukprot:PhM_4_TR17396/c0_g1_i1/m.92897
MGNNLCSTSIQVATSPKLTRPHQQRGKHQSHHPQITVLQNAKPHRKDSVNVLNNPLEAPPQQDQDAEEGRRRDHDDGHDEEGDHLLLDLMFPIPHPDDNEDTARHPSLRSQESVPPLLISSSLMSNGISNSYSSSDAVMIMATMRSNSPQTTCSSTHSTPLSQSLTPRSILRRRSTTTDVGVADVSPPRRRSVQIVVPEEHRVRDALLLQSLGESENGIDSNSDDVGSHRTTCSRKLDNSQGDLLDDD